jgi:bacterioferritin-associated ferredoxin
VLDETAFDNHYQVQKMIVCFCHPTSDRDVDAVIDEGARSVEDIGRRCGAGTGCGSCVEDLRDRLTQRGVAGCPRDAATPLVNVRPR